MKKIILGGILIVLVIVLYFLFSSSREQIDQKVKSVQSVTKDVSSQSQKDEFPLLEITEDEVEENLTLAISQIDLNISQEDNKSDTKEERIVDIFVETNIDEVSKDFPPKEEIEPLTAINIPKSSIKNLKIGDIVYLPNMGDGEFNAQIISKKIHKSGTVTVTGHLLDDGGDYSVVLTEGKNMSFGTITTPNGAFEIEARGGKGYIYSAEAINSAMIDYSKDDTLIPNRDYKSSK